MLDSEILCIVSDFRQTTALILGYDNRGNNTFCAIEQVTRAFDYVRIVGDSGGTTQKPGREVNF